MMSLHEAILKIDCKRPSLVKKSLLPDVKESEHTKIKLKALKKSIKIEVKSRKISYLKAVVNSYLSLVKMLKEIDEDGI